MNNPLASFPFLLHMLFLVPPNIHIFSEIYVIFTWRLISVVCLDFHLYSLLKAQSLFLPHGWYNKKQTRRYLEHFEICLHLSLAEKYLNRVLTFLYKFHANVIWILIYSQILEDEIPIALFELWVHRKGVMGYKLT